MNLNQRTKELLEPILECFRTGDITEKIAYATFPESLVPMSRWSLSNKIICIFSGTNDARGYRQWQKVGRSVKKGASAIHILAPIFSNSWVTREYETEDEKGNKGIGTQRVKVQYLIGFKAVPVFRYEDTEGDPLPDLPEVKLDLPLVNVAEAAGVTITTGYYDGWSLGFFRPSENLIEMHTDEEHVFLHELCHALHKKTCKNFDKQSYNYKEVVAELGSNVLMALCGRDWKKYSGSSYSYIESYAKDGDVHSACMSVLHDIENIMSFVFSCTTPVGVVGEDLTGVASFDDPHRWGN